METIGATIIQSAICRTYVRHRPAPSLFYFPGLNNIKIYNKSQYNSLFHYITNQLQSNHDNILNDYYKIVEIQSNNDVTKDEHNKLHKGQWDWNSYIHKGIKQNQFSNICIDTTNTLESLHNHTLIKHNINHSSSLMYNIPFSYAFFSTLKKGSSISSHNGPCNIRIRCHYPLIIPDGDIGMRIGDEKIKWTVGEPLFFDDCYEHEVWNNGDGDRVVLLFDIWHPDLYDDEIEAITNMFNYASQQGWTKKN